MRVEAYEDVLQSRLRYRASIYKLILKGQRMKLAYTEMLKVMKSKVKDQSHQEDSITRREGFVQGGSLHFHERLRIWKDTIRNYYIYVKMQSNMKKLPFS